MRIILALLLGIGAVSAVACKSERAPEVQQSDTVTVTLAITGMT